MTEKQNNSESKEQKPKKISADAIGRTICFLFGLGIGLYGAFFTGNPGHIGLGIILGVISILPVSGDNLYY